MSPEQLYEECFTELTRELTTQLTFITTNQSYDMNMKFMFLYIHSLQHEMVRKVRATNQESAISFSLDCYVH